MEELDGNQFWLASKFEENSPQSRRLMELNAFVRSMKAMYRERSMLFMALFLKLVGSEDHVGGTSR